MPDTMPRRPFLSRAAGAAAAACARPLAFAGRRLAVNFATAEGGSLAVEAQGADGKALEGFALADCRPLRGDAIEEAVAWKAAPDLAPLAAKPVRLRFALKNADLFSFQFIQ